MALTDPPRHRQLRALVDEWFTVRAVRGIEEQLRVVAQQVVSEAIACERVDFCREVAARMPLYVICQMMGVAKSDWSYIFELTSQAFSATDIAAQRDAHLSIILYFSELADARAAKPEGDLVSVLACAEVEGEKLTPDELVLYCDNLLVGGTENTRIAATGGMMAFIEHRDQWETLAACPELMPTAIEEVLRWTSTADARRSGRRRLPLSSGTGRSLRASGSRCGIRQLTATRKCSPTRTGSTFAGSPTGTWPSAPGSISVLARRSPVPNSACFTTSCSGRPTPWNSTARRSGLARSS